MRLIRAIVRARPWRILVLALLLAMPACSKSLQSHQGPTAGLVTGLVCDDLSSLAAVNEVPEVGAILVREGKCMNLRSAARVHFIRTVVMPGDGEYSQFELLENQRLLKLWIRTELVKAV